jgi:2-methylcitrate dehydratase
LRLFEGPNGLDRMFGQTIAVDWTAPSLEVVRQTMMKKYCSLIHGQPVLEAVLDLKRRHELIAADIASVVCEIFQSGFDIAGGGSFGPKDHPTTKEQADYNLKYLIAAALLDDQVGPAQLEEARINATDAQTLLAKIEIRPNPEFTANYPRHLDCQITMRTRDGREFTKTQRGYEGGLEHPLTWARTVEKFHWLAEPFADIELRGAIIAAVETLDRRPLSDLLGLLGQVMPRGVFPATRHFIQ